MREIKFREPITDQWGRPAGFHYWGIINDIFIPPRNEYRLSAKISEQYTGYGNIFANDFIEEGLVFWSEEYLGWFVKLFEYQYERNIMPLHDCSENIIGNIHVNPELLEKIK